MDLRLPDHTHQQLLRPTAFIHLFVILSRSVLCDAASRSDLRDLMALYARNIQERSLRRSVASFFCERYKSFVCERYQGLTSALNWPAVPRPPFVSGIKGSPTL
jgi:hypothetical protein